MVVESAAGAVQDASRRAIHTLSPCLTAVGPQESREQWAGAVDHLQQLINVASAAQDAAIARLAAIEPEVAADGTLREAHRALGHVALDAAAIVSGALRVSSVHAERRVRTAVRFAGDGPGAARETGLGGLHSAMSAGRLDSYRASVVADELEDTPVEVAAGVVASLDPFFGHEDAPMLRRRCRRVLARVSPDLLRQRARRARAESGLRRWVDEPGVDRWAGTFPSEDAARAWAAIDELAQRYVHEGVCEGIDRARAKALTDLVEGSATIETMVTLVHAEMPDLRPAAETVSEPSTPSAVARHDAHSPTPAQLVAPTGTTSATERSRSDEHSTDLVEVTGLCSGEPVLVERSWLDQAVADTRAVGRDRCGRVRVLACDPVSGALLDPLEELSTDAYRPGAHLSALVKGRDRRCRFPGCHVSARFCDLDHVRPWPAGPTATKNLICLCRRHHRIKQRTGWSLTLLMDATVTWTDPTGRTRTTHPMDALHAVVLGASQNESPVPVSRAPRQVVPGGPHTPLEFTLEHHLGGHWRSPRATLDVLDVTIRCLPVATVIAPGCRRRRSRPSATDPPPF